MKTMKVTFTSEYMSIEKDGVEQMFELTDTPNKEVFKQIKDANPNYNVEMIEIVKAKAEPIENIVEPKPSFKENIKAKLEERKKDSYRVLHKFYGDRIKEKDYPKVRRWFQINNVTSLSVGVCTGVVFGKTLLTGAAIGTGAYIVSSIVGSSFIDYKVKQLNK